MIDTAALEVALMGGGETSQISSYDSYCDDLGLQCFIKSQVCHLKFEIFRFEHFKLPFPTTLLG